MKKCNCVLDLYAIDQASGIGYLIETYNSKNRDQRTRLTGYMAALNSLVEAGK